MSQDLPTSCDFGKSDAPIVEKNIDDGRSERGRGKEKKMIGSRSAGGSDEENLAPSAASSLSLSSLPKRTGLSLRALPAKNIPVVANTQSAKQHPVKQQYSHPQDKQRHATAAAAMADTVSMD